MGVAPAHLLGGIQTVKEQLLNVAKMAKINQMVQDVVLPMEIKVLYKVIVSVANANI